MNTKKKIFLGLGILFSILAIGTAIILVPPLLELNRIFQEYQKAYGQVIIKCEIYGDPKLVIIDLTCNNPNQTISLYTDAGFEIKAVVDKIMYMQRMNP
jgi:hypothetical protein